jgi:tetratricopeptide (TPR) repeat protein
VINQRPTLIQVANPALGLALAFAAVLTISAPVKAGPAKAGPAASKAAPASAKVGTNPAPTSIYAQGVQAYQAGRYNEAAVYMYDSITKEKAGANAWLYMAHSYYALGQRKRAEETYQKLKDNFPGTPQANLAEQFVLRLNPNAKKSGSASGATASSASSSKGDAAAGSEASTEAPADIAATKEGMKLLRKRVTIVRPVYGHDPVNERTIKAVDACFDKIPPIVQAILFKGNIQFVITPTMIDKYPAGAYQEVAGYEGGTDKSCPGLFTGNTVVLSQATVNEATNEVKRPRDADDLQGTFLHETGHAVDACLDWYSCTKEFRHNYYLDIARVPDDVAPRIRYYLQKSDRGQSEACAELTSILLGNQRGNYQDMVTYFPLTMKYIKGKLGL